MSETSELAGHAATDWSSAPASSTVPHLSRFATVGFPRLEAQRIAAVAPSSMHHPLRARFAGAARESSSRPECARLRALPLKASSQVSMRSPSLKVLALVSMRSPRSKVGPCAAPSRAMPCLRRRSCRDEPLWTARALALAMRVAEHCRPATRSALVVFALARMKPACSLRSLRTMATARTSAVSALPHAARSGRSMFDRSPQSIATTVSVERRFATQTSVTTRNVRRIAACRSSIGQICDRSYVLRRATHRPPSPTTSPARSLRLRRRNHSRR